MAKQETLNKKSAEVEATVELFKSASSIVVAEYRGLTVAEVSELRRELRKENCELHVLKNNISRRALEALGHNEFENTLVGPNAICVAKGESVYGPKILSDFSAKHKALVLKDGIVDGDYYDAKKLLEIAQLPSRQTLLSMLAGGMIQPLQQLAVGMQMVAEQKQN